MIWLGLIPAANFAQLPAAPNRCLAETAKLPTLLAACAVADSAAASVEPWRSTPLLGGGLGDPVAETTSGVVGSGPSAVSWPGSRTIPAGANCGLQRGFIRRVSKF